MMTYGKLACGGISTPMPRWTNIVIAYLIILAANNSFAGEGEKEIPPSPVYKLNPAVDGPVFFLAGFVTVGWFLGDELGPADCAPLCNRRDVNSFDRWSAGYYDEDWARVTDFTLMGIMGVGVVSLFVDESFRAGLVDLFVVAESVLLANGLVVALNLMARRPRPYLYSQEAPLDVRNSGTASLSFGSGHVAATTSFTTAMFGVFHARHPGSSWPWVFLGVGTAASGVIAAGRIMSGRHFMSDVIIGGVAGICMGILVPAVHEKNVIIAPTIIDSGAGLALTKAF